MFNTYLKEISRYEVLDAGTQNELLEKAHEGNARARTKLVNHNLKLVVSIALKYQSNNVDIMDLIQEGNLGLIKAIDDFDLSKGNNLSTYAYHWIRYYIVKYLKSSNKYTNLEDDDIIIDYGDTPFDYTIKAELKSKIDNLDKIDNFIITSYYGLDTQQLTLTEISKIVNMSIEGVRKRKNNILTKLKGVN